MTEKLLWYLNGTCKTVLWNLLEFALWDARGNIRGVYLKEIHQECRGSEGSCCPVDTAGCFVLWEVWGCENAEQVVTRKQGPLSCWDPLALLKDTSSCVSWWKTSVGPVLLSEQVNKRFNLAVR